MCNLVAVNIDVSLQLYLESKGDSLTQMSRSILMECSHWFQELFWGHRTELRWQEYGPSYEVMPNLIWAWDSSDFPCRVESQGFSSVARINLQAWEITGDIRLFLLQILHVCISVDVQFTRNSPVEFKVLRLSVQVWSLRRLVKGETFSHRVTTLVYI